jgi:general secretion pathway protein A
MPYQEQIILDSAGFLLIDNLFHPVYANPESIKILGYPNSIPNAAAVEEVLKQKISSILPRDFVGARNSCVIQFQSGRRRYTCRAFVLENHWGVNPSETRIALLLERGLPGPPSDAKKRLKFGGTYEDPFSFTPDPKYYHFNRAHQEVLSSLIGVIREYRGIGVLLGQAGMGKTVLLNYLAQKIQDESEVVFIPGSFDSRADLVHGVMSLLGVYKQGGSIAEDLLHLEAWLLSKYRAGKKITLICDDAHRLTAESLESLCVLADLEKSSKKLIQILVAGRQELLQKLTCSQLGSMGFEANVFCRLAPLDEAEVCSYVLHRLRIAGCTKQLFSSDALAAIALYSRGIPLNINMLCRHSMSIAATINLQFVDEKIVADSAYDLVLRAQPPSRMELPEFNSNPRQAAGLLRDRRGLKLVKKPTNP